MVVLKALSDGETHQGTLVYTTLKDSGQEIWWVFGSNGELIHAKGIGAPHDKLGDMDAISAAGISNNEFANDAYQELRSRLDLSGVVL